MFFVTTIKIAVRKYFLSISNYISDKDNRPKGKPQGKNFQAFMFSTRPQFRY